TQQWQRKRAQQARKQRALTQCLDTRGNQLRKSLRGLEKNIADKTITDDDVSLSPKESITLDKTAVVEVNRLLQQKRGRLDLLIALDRLGSHVQQCHPRPLNP